MEQPISLRDMIPRERGTCFNSPKTALKKGTTGTKHVWPQIKARRKLFSANRIAEQMSPQTYGLWRVQAQSNDNMRLQQCPRLHTCHGAHRTLNATTNRGLHIRRIARRPVMREYLLESFFVEKSWKSESEQRSSIEQGNLNQFCSQADDLHAE